jgi:hypothetical protein
VTQQSLINEGIAALKEKGINIDSTVELVKFRNKDVKAIAKNETIYICENSFEDRLLTTCVKLLSEGVY